MSPAAAPSRWRPAIQSDTSPLSGRPGSSSQRTSEATPARAAPTAAAWRQPMASWSGTITTRALRRVALSEERHLPAPPGVGGRSEAKSGDAVSVLLFLDDEGNSSP